MGTLLRAHRVHSPDPSRPQTTWGAFRALAATATRTPQTSMNGAPPPPPPPVNAGQRGSGGGGGAKAAVGGRGLGLDPGSRTLGEVLSLQGLGQGVVDSTPMTHADLIILYTVRRGGADGGGGTKAGAG